jgi:simple sugar transport system permease protein
VRAAQSAGAVNPVRTTALVFLASGALAGLGGASEATGVTLALYEGLSPGYGYSAIAVALLARLHPLAIVLSAVLFGALEAGAASMQRDADVPSVLAAVVEALLVLGVLAIDYARVRGRRDEH